MVVRRQLMFRVSHDLVLWFAAAVWLAGAVACYDLAHKLLTTNNPSPTQLYTSLGCGLFVGILLGVTFFSRLALANVQRIDKLEDPRPWHAYRLRFFVFLVIFDGGSVLIGEYLAKDDVSRCVIGSIDLTIACALLVSLTVYIYQYFYGGFGAARKMALGSPLLKTGAEDDEFSTIE